MRWYKPQFVYNLGQMVHIVMRRTLAKHVGEDDPIPPAPEPDPLPPVPEPDPLPPPPDPEPIPPAPEPDPIPPPPDPVDWPHDRLPFAGVVVLMPVKWALSHKGRYWLAVTERQLEGWDVQDFNHMDEILEEIASHRAACFVFLLDEESALWGDVRDYVVSRGGVVGVTV